MKVLLTGPFGKIGYRVLEALLAKGHTVTCFDLDSPANRKTARDFSGPALADRVRVIWGDITNASQVAAAVAGQDAVIHNAAIIPPLSDRNPPLAEKVNVGGTRNILDAIRQMAGMGMGLALLPRLYVRQEVREGDEVVVRPFVGGRHYREIGLVWRAGAGRAPAGARSHPQRRTTESARSARREARHARP